MIQRDTSKNAQKILTDIYRNMSYCDKVSRIFQAYQTGRILAMAGLRQLFPEANEKEIWQLWAKRHLGEKLFSEVYGETKNG